MRTTLVYGHVAGGRSNFVSWLVGELRAGRRVRIVDDQINTPTLADDLAAALLQLERGGGEGIFHVARPELVSRLEWARVIARYYRLNPDQIDSASSAELRQVAQRPLRSGLRTMRQAELGGVAMRGTVAGFEALGLR